MRIAAIIPARFASTRLPGKPLRQIAGKPMIQWVWEHACQAKFIDEVIVATDDERIRQAISSLGGHAVMTPAGCVSGTDRIYTVMDCVNADIYMNIQGDEPLLSPMDIDRLAKFMRDNPNIPAATLYAPISTADAEDPNLVKIVTSPDGRALYFSRAKIPYERGVTASYKGHMGIYAYHASTLRHFATLPESVLERTEKLEQLRLLETGLPFYAVQATAMTTGVDTEDDLKQADRVLAGIGLPGELPWGEIKLVISDVDGTLTDGGLWYSQDGDCLKRFNARDGLAVELAQKAGVEIAVASGRDSLALRKRLEDLGIQKFVLGSNDKAEASKKLIMESGLEPWQALFLGDDFSDIAGFSACAFGVSVQDAAKEARDAAAWITPSKGGEGALRDVVTKILATLTCRQLAN